MIVDRRLPEFITNHFRTKKTPVAFFTKIPEACPADELKDYLSSDECSRAARFRVRSDHDSFVVAHVIKRVSLGALVNQAPIDVQLALGSHGKPMLDRAKYKSTIQFSLSHAKGIVAFAVSPDTFIGVDVEQSNPNGHSDNPYESFLSTQEIELLGNVSATKRHDAFLKLWTAKEAYIKGVGLGLSLSLESFFVETLDYNSRICDSISGRPLHWSTQSIQPTPRHFMSAAVHCRTKPDCRVTFVELPIQMIR